VLSTLVCTGTVLTTACTPGVTGTGAGPIMSGPLAKLAVVKSPNPRVVARTAADSRRFFIFSVYSSELQNRRTSKQANFKTGLQVDIALVSFTYWTTALGKLLKKFDF